MCHEQPEFSDSSYGFRPGRNAHPAVTAAQAYVAAGKRWVVDIDLEKQGGPLSPLLSNVVLTELDRELERRGHTFCRYADDCNIYVGSREAGERVMRNVTEFVEARLKLKVNLPADADQTGVGIARRLGAAHAALPAVATMEARLRALPALEATGLGRDSRTALGRRPWPVVELGRVADALGAPQVLL